VGLVARSTERPYRSQPWAQQRGADGAQARDGRDDSSREQGARARCTQRRIHLGRGYLAGERAPRAGVSRWGLSGGDTVSAAVQTGP